MYDHSMHRIQTFIGSIPVESTRESPWWAYRPPCHRTYPACMATGQSWDDQQQSSRKIKAVVELGTPLGQHSYHSVVMLCRVHDICMQEPLNPNYIRVWHPHLHRRSPVRRGRSTLSTQWPCELFNMMYPNNHIRYASSDLVTLYSSASAANRSGCNEVRTLRIRNI